MILDTLYTLYTEDKPNVAELVSRYFTGATIYHASGLWNGALESTIVVEIVASETDLQNIVNLAGDIKHANAQDSVLVTWARVSSLLV